LVFPLFAISYASPLIPALKIVEPMILKPAMVAAAPATIRTASTNLQE
jgi:hypothetical protein